MKRLWPALALGFQLLVPAWMVAEREMIVDQGRRIHLRTAPIDPRDIFRGDYVRLEYEVSTLAPTLLSEELAASEIRRGQSVYTELQVGPGDLAHAVGVTLSKPASGIYLRGRAEASSKPGAGPLRLTYGIEKYFVQQGRGIEIEQKRGGRDDVQIPLEMEVAVDGAGSAILVGYRWSPLGIGLKVLRAPTTSAPAESRNAVFELVLQNVSDQALQLPLLPGSCSFSLESVADAPVQVRHRYGGCASIERSRASLAELAPGEQRSFEFDFNDPGWDLIQDGVAVPIGKLPWNQRFRLVYHSGAGSGGSAWQGELPSRALHGSGQID